MNILGAPASDDHATTFSTVIVILLGLISFYKRVYKYSKVAAIRSSLIGSSETKPGFRDLREYRAWPGVHQLQKKLLSHYI